MPRRNLAPKSLPKANRQRRNWAPDLTGQRFGRLTVVSRGPNSLTNNARWNCLCDCGGRSLPIAKDLRSGHTKSCRHCSADSANDDAALKPELRSRFEIWREIPKTNSEISNWGRVRWAEGQKIRKRTRTTGGYLIIRLKLDGKCRNYGVHRLVLTVFRGPCPAGQQGRHINGRPNDNRLENLAWGTRIEDAWDRHILGRTPSGERHYMAKLTWKDVDAIRQAKGPRGLTTQLAKAYGVSHHLISRIRLGRTWRSYPLA